MNPSLQCQELVAGMAGSILWAGLVLKLTKAISMTGRKRLCVANGELAKLQGICGGSLVVAIA